MKPRDRFRAALDGTSVDRPPVWLMRQAGRYLPGYRDLRARHSFWDVCRTPALAAEASLEPMRLFPLDAAIVFSDILVVPQALGLEVTFGAGEGPTVGRPLRSRSDLEAWRIQGAGERLGFVAESVRALRTAVGSEHGLLGFAGAPWTLFCYAVEGRGDGEFARARALLRQDPELAHDALAALAGVVADLLISQHRAGADAIQLFDTWGGLLSEEDWRAFALPPLARIVSHLRAADCPSLLYVRGGSHLLDAAAETGADGLSLDWRIRWSEARRRHPRRTLQGNLDPATLFAPEPAVRAAARALLDEIRSHDGGRRSIVNLGHGILPGTPEENVRALVHEVTDA